MAKAWNKIDWNEDRINFLKKNWKTKTNKELADALGLRLTSVRTKLYSLGFKRMDLQYWTEEQIQYLRDNYQKIGDTEMAEIFNQKWDKKKGWSKKHIEKKRRYLKLKRTPEEIAKIHLGHIKRGAYAEGVRKMWQTRGTNEIGTIVIWDGNKMIKTESGYQFLRLVNYRKFVGEIPKGMMVRHIDGNRLNCGPENLVLITRTENARLNAAIRCPPELRETMKLLRKLQLKIKRKTSKI